MTICKITVFALVRELQALQRYDLEYGRGWIEQPNPEGEYIRVEDFLAVMARNVIPVPEGSTP